MRMKKYLYLLIILLSSCQSGAFDEDYASAVSLRYNNGSDTNLVDMSVIPDGDGGVGNLWKEGVLNYNRKVYIPPYNYVVNIELGSDGNIISVDQLVCTNPNVDGYRHWGGGYFISSSSYDGETLTYKIDTYYIHVALYPNLHEMNEMQFLERHTLTVTATIPRPRPY